MKRIIALIGFLLFVPAVYADEIRTAGATGQCFSVFVNDSSSTTGAGLTGLAYDSASLTCFYFRNETATGETATTCSLATSTLGTHPGATSTGFKEISSANMPGWYELCLLDAALATGASSVSVGLKGATNMAPVNLRVLLFGTADVNVATISNDAITAAAIAAGAIGASEFAAESEINAEVLDVLNVDTFTELTSCPAATASFKTMVQYLYMLGRNKLTQTATTGTLFRDDGSTGLCTFTDSDSAGTTTRGEGG